MSARLPRTVWMLSLANGWLFVGNSLLITVSALIGFDLADDKRIATLPLALQFLAIMCTTIPASLFMGRFGRKPGFLLAGVIGLCGAALALTAILTRRFEVYCAATIAFGIVAAFGNYYRFTAAEVVPADVRPRAISAVMLGGVVAAFIGPNLANLGSGLLAAHALAGPFLILMLVYVLSMATIALTDLPPRAVKTAVGESGRTLATIAAQPVFIIAVICQMFGYGMMNLVMTSTPLAMQAKEFGLGATAVVIQWHVVAMFAPSFVTGHLIKRFGIVSVLATGVVLGVATVAINYNGTSFPHFLVALALLGVSWNFLFVGGTSLVTECHRPEERARTQALNDFLVFSMVSVTALSAGTLHFVFGWRIVNLGVLPLLFVTAVAVCWLALRQHVTQLEQARATSDTSHATQEP